MAFCPSTAESNPSGLNDPVNGAVPAVIDVAASSSSVVLVKFCPLPPSSVKSSTRVPIGLIRNTSRSASNVCVMLSVTLTSPIGPETPLTLMIDVIVLTSGIVLGTSVDAGV